MTCVVGLLMRKKEKRKKERKTQRVPLMCYPPPYRAETSPRTHLFISHDDDDEKEKQAASHQSPVTRQAGSRISLIKIIITPHW